MKYVKISILIICLIAFNSLNAQDYNPEIYKISRTINADTLSHFVKVLSGEEGAVINGKKDTIRSRWFEYEGNMLARNYLSGLLESYGYYPYLQKFNSKGENIIAVKEGKLNPEVKYIICAHYDAALSDLNEIVPGADDNASGTAGVLEAARALAKYNTKYTIIFVFFNQEEIGLYGSNFFANSINKEDNIIGGVINLDMIGYDGNADRKVFIQAPRQGFSDELCDIIESVNSVYQIGLTTVIKKPGIPDSDHSSFWKYGNPSVMIGEDIYGDMNYKLHTIEDKFENIVVDFFQKNASLATTVIATLAGIMNDEINVSERLQAGFSLSQNYPNPFNEITVIEYYIPENSQVQLKLYDALGKEIVVLFNASLISGHHNFILDSRKINDGLSPGIYYFSMSAGQYFNIKKMLIIR